ncbi:MAG TPA: GNAT family N-acetyltransferase [Candidatus Cybelea sp.]|nr:GNAT family N-acetyltransferase [Candidatus Cybelea sp.]
MTALFNLVVDLDAIVAPRATDSEIGAPESADERTLAWIDETFGGAWSSEARAGSNVIARDGGAPIGFATIDARGLQYRWLAGLARERDVGLFGPFGVEPAQRERGLGGALLRRSLAALQERGYRRALIAAVGDELVPYYARACGARAAERFERADLLAPPPRTLVMASGNGSNFQAVIAAQHAGTLPLQLVGLLSNDGRAPAIVRARDAGVPVAVETWDRGREPRARYDARLIEATAAFAPDLVLLLGWMHLLSRDFVERFDELLNLHPAFLPLDPQRDEVVTPDGRSIPAFRGARAVRDALARESPWVGATVHRVTAETDRGPVLARKPLRVNEGEEEGALMERLHRVEHTLVKAAIARWLFERPPEHEKKEIEE